MHLRDRGPEVKVQMALPPTASQWVEPPTLYSHSQRTKRELTLTTLKGFEARAHQTRVPLVLLADVHLLETLAVDTATLAL